MSKRNSKPKRPNKKRHEPRDQLHATVAALLDLAKARALRKRVPFALTTSHIPHLAASRACPVTGLPFVLGVVREGSRPHPLAPSIDRIEAKLGYVPGNVRLTSWWANSARNNLTDEQFSVFVEAAYRVRQATVLQ